MKPFQSERAKRAQGLSLIELMISIALGMVIVGALLALFLNVTRTNNEMAKMNRQIENGRFAIQLLQGDLVHAGFWGDFIPQFEDRGVAVPDDVPTAIPAPCKEPATWNAVDRNNLIGIPVQADAEGCAVVASQAPGTDVLVVRHAEPTVGSAACGAGDVCFQASQCGLEITDTPPQKYVLGTTGHTLHKKDCEGTGSPAVMPIKPGSDTALMRKFISNIYYVRDDFTLMRSEFSNGAHLAAQPLIDGIEGFRVEYGIDNVGKDGEAVSYTGAVNRGDGVPDTYVSCAPCTFDQLTNVVTVRIHVLARSPEATPGYSDTKTYAMGSAAPICSTAGSCSNKVLNPSFKRHVFTTTVRLVNPAGRRETP
ncbi:MAG: PilW family protein [Burkholderiaceae bacterium]|nr:PilW family protein [Burkholderiaceae bacterium]